MAGNGAGKMGFTCASIAQQCQAAARVAGLKLGGVGFETLHDVALLVVSHAVAADGFFAEALRNA